MIIVKVESFPKKVKTRNSLCFDIERMFSLLTADMFSYFLHVCPIESGQAVMFVCMIFMFRMMEVFPANTVYY